MIADQTLQALLKESIVNNLDVRAAVARVEEARARAGISNSLRYPQIDFGANYGARFASDAQDDKTGDEDNAHQNTTYGFHFSWEIVLFGRLRRQ